MTDSAWELFGKWAESQEMTRADLLERLVQDWEESQTIFQPLPTEHIEPAKPIPAKKQSSSSRSQYYLQLSYSRGKRWEYWYWNGSELFPKAALHPSKGAKTYNSKAGAITAAKKLQPHVDQFASKVRQPIGLLSLKPVRVTW